MNNKRSNKRKRSSSSKRGSNKLPSLGVSIPLVRHPDEPERLVTESFPFERMDPPVVAKDGKEIECLVHFSPSLIKYRDIESPEEKGKFFFECVKYGMRIEIPQDVNGKISILSCRERHGREKENATFFICLPCAIIDWNTENGYSSRTSLHVHLTKKHPKSHIPLWQCGVCEKKFVEPEELKEHRKFYDKNNDGGCHIRVHGRPDLFHLPSEPLTHENYFEGRWKFVTAEVFYPYEEDTGLLEYEHHEATWTNWLLQFQDVLKTNNDSSTSHTALKSIWRECTSKAFPNGPGPKNRQPRIPQFKNQSESKDTLTWDLDRILQLQTLWNMEILDSPESSPTSSRQSSPEPPSSISRPSSPEFPVEAVYSEEDVSRESSPLGFIITPDNMEEVGSSSDGDEDSNVGGGVHLDLLGSSTEANNGNQSTPSRSTCTSSSVEEEMSSCEPALWEVIRDNSDNLIRQNASNILPSKLDQVALGEQVTTILGQGCESLLVGPEDIQNIAAEFEPVATAEKQIEGQNHQISSNLIEVNIEQVPSSSEPGSAADPVVSEIIEHIQKAAHLPERAVSLDLEDVPVIPATGEDNSIASTDLVEQFVSEESVIQAVNEEVKQDLTSPVAETSTLDAAETLPIMGPVAVEVTPDRLKVPPAFEATVSLVEASGSRPKILRTYGRKKKVEAEPTGPTEINLGPNKSPGEDRRRSKRLSRVVEKK